MARTVERRFGRRAAIPLAERRWASLLAAAAQRREEAGAQRGAVRHSLDPTPGAARLGGLDILRLLAALAVVLFHFGFAGPMRAASQTEFPAIAGVAKYGFLGVDLFFLISGFVIAASVTGRSWQQFAVARLLRLYPAHLVCMTATALVVAVLGGSSAAVTPWQWLANLTMVAPVLGQPFMDAAYWSIVLELVFYGWVAVMVAAGVLERRLLAILTVWLAVAYLNEVIFQLRVLRIVLVTEYAALFASGILIHRLRAGERNPYAWALLGFAFGLGLLHAMEHQRVVAAYYGDALSLPILWLLHVGIYGVFAAALWISPLLPPSRVIMTVGGLTYPLYLVHQQAGYLLIDGLAPWAGRWPAMALVVGLMLAFAWAVHRWAEPAGRRLITSGIDRLTVLVPWRSAVRAR